MTSMATLCLELMTQSTDVIGEAITMIYQRYFLSNFTWTKLSLWKVITPDFLLLNLIFSYFRILTPWMLITISYRM